MNTHSSASSDKTVDGTKKNAVQKVMNLYGIFLFSGLLMAIFAHGIYEVVEFFFFICISGVVYFLLLNLYPRSDRWRKLVFAVLCLIGLASLFMVFYLQANPPAYS